jgi:predicted ArsR family transcriptional regulator
MIIALVSRVITIAQVGELILENRRFKIQDLAGALGLSVGTVKEHSKDSVLTAIKFCN